MSANIPPTDYVATDETGNLISAGKVTGTNVYKGISSAQSTT